MMKTEPRTLVGIMELLPNEQILFNQIKLKIENTYCINNRKILN